jgi:hypothetical protein
MVSGGLHPELLKTDELEVIPAALKAIDWIVTGLTMMKGRFGKVYVPAVCGNHGRNTAKPEFKRYAKKNFDYLISRIVERHFADDPDVRVCKSWLYVTPRGIPESLRCACSAISVNLKLQPK